MREQHMQIIRENERKRMDKKRKQREAEDDVMGDMKRKLGEAEDDVGKDFDSETEQQEHRRKIEVLSRCEIFNAPARSCSAGWIPYVSSSDEEDRDAPFSLKNVSWRVERFAVELAQSVILLESFTGNRKLFTCCGIIVEFANGIGYVVTATTLVRCRDDEKEIVADELKINALLPSGEILNGSVVNLDFYHNICVIKIQSPFKLRSKSFSANIGFEDFYKNSIDVVALGRRIKHLALKIALGKLIPRSQSDCEEPLFSTCKSSKRHIGGPLMDFDGNIIGLNVYGKKGTPFLPSPIVLKCLEHFRNFGKVIRPLHGLQVKHIPETLFPVLDEMGICGVIVEKVEEGSCAECCKIGVGDIITHIDGICLHSTAQFASTLLDMCGDRLKMSLSDDTDQMATVLTLKFGVIKATGGKYETETKVININKYKHTFNGINRWPLPKPIIVRTYIGDRFTGEEWFTTS